MTAKDGTEVPDTVQFPTASETRAFRVAGRDGWYRNVTAKEGELYEGGAIRAVLMPAGSMLRLVPIDAKPKEDAMPILDESEKAEAEEAAKSGDGDRAESDHLEDEPAKAAGKKGKAAAAK